MTNRIYMVPPQPGYYVLRDPQKTVVDEGEDRCAEFCIRAREMGVGAGVEEIQHPQREGTPFGFHYGVMPGEKTGI